MLNGRKESDTYLATVCRYCWSRQITMKVDKLLELSANISYPLLFGHLGAANLQSPR